VNYPFREGVAFRFIERTCPWSHSDEGSQAVLS